MFSQITKQSWFRKEKYWIGSAFLLGSSFLVNVPSIQLGLGAGFIYCALQRLGFLQISLLKDRDDRGRRLHEQFLNSLTRYHLLQSKELQRWVSPNTLIIGKPRVVYENQGLKGFLKRKLGKETKEDMIFDLNVNFKDVKFYGEGVIFCEGYFISMSNYYFKKMKVITEKPRSEEFVILDDNIIEV